MNASFLSFLLWDHSAWAGWIFQAAAVSLALSLAGLAAAALTRKSHPSLRCLILTVFIAAPAGVLTTGFPFPAIGQAVNVPADQGAGLSVDPGRAGASHREQTMGVSIFQRHTAGIPIAGADWRMPEAVRSSIHMAGLVWLGGSGIVFCLALPGWRRLRSWRRGTRLDSPFEGIPVLVSDHCPLPMCAGMLRPVILLPAWLADLPDSQRAAALRHEAAHIRHGDLWLLRLQWIMAGLYWWNPLQRRLSRRLDTALEERADQSVLRAGTPVADYAQCLLNCAGRISAGPSQPATMGPGLGLAMAKSAPAAKTRILALLSRGSLAVPGRIRRGVCLLGALAVALPVCGLTPSPVFAEEPAVLDSKEAQPKPATQAAAAVPPAQAPTAGESANTKPAAEPVEPSTLLKDEALNKILTAWETVWEGAPIDQSKPGRTAIVSIRTDQITIGKDDTVTLRNNVRITFSKGYLEAEQCTISRPRPSAEQKPARPVIMATGKYKLRIGIQLIEGRSEESSFQITETGNVIANDSIFRTVDP